MLKNTSYLLKQWAAGEYDKKEPMPRLRKKRVAKKKIKASNNNVISGKEVK